MKLAAASSVRLNRQRLVSPQAITLELSRILQSEGFVRARRMQRFLEFIVEETLAGRADQLCEYTIGTSVFERPESFEPALDPIVRNDARRLRRKLFDYYAHAGNNETVTISVPKGGYVPVFQPGTAQQYRLSISLVRMTDNAELWTTEEEIEISEYSAEDCFRLQLQLKSPVPRLVLLPTRQSSSRAHKSNK